jgi:hypothetical protein
VRKREKRKLKDVAGFEQIDNYLDTSLSMGRTWEEEPHVYTEYSLLTA